MRRLPKKLVTLLVAVIVVGGLVFVGSSIRSTPATPVPASTAPTPNSPGPSWQAFRAHVPSSPPRPGADTAPGGGQGPAGETGAAASAAVLVKADATTEVA